jgi:hypothetical protein
MALIKREVLDYSSREQLKRIAGKLKELGGCKKESDELILIARWQRYLEPENGNRYLTLKGYKQWRKKNPKISY